MRSLETWWKINNLMFYDAHSSKSVTHKLYKCCFFARRPWLWFTNIPLSLFSIFCGNIHISFPSKLSAGSYSQAVWHQSDLSWQLCRYKKKCEGRSTSKQGWLSLIYIRVKMRFKNTTTPLMLFTHSPQTLNLSRSEYKKKQRKPLPHREGKMETSWCCMILFWEEQVRFYAMGVPR